MAHWKQRETVFAAYGLGLTMPGAWQLRQAEDPVRWIYRAADHREHLTITRGEPLMPRKASEVPALLQRVVVRSRRAVELGFSRQPGLEISEAEYGGRFGVPAGWFAGGAAGDHRFWSLLLCPPDAVWTFFYDTFKLPREEAEERATALFDSVKIKSA